MPVKHRILVDASVWIDYFRQGEGGVVEKLNGYIESGSASVNGLVMAEIVPFVRSEREQREVEQLLRGLHYLPFLDDDWATVGRLQGILQKKSGNPVPVPDLVMAATCIRHGALLFTLDRHFQMIARHSDLKLV
ncbi:MAG: PIN domain-containing protein [Fibrobacterota bacterium]